MKIYEKLDKIKSDLQVWQQNSNQQQLLHLDLGQKKGVDQADLGVLFQMLFRSQQDQVKNRDLHKLLEWEENIILKLAKKLKKHMEDNEKSIELKESMEAQEKREMAKHEQGEAGEERKEELEHKNEEKGDKGGGGHKRKDEEENKAKDKGGGVEDKRNKEQGVENQKGEDGREAREEENKVENQKGGEKEREEQKGGGGEKDEDNSNEEEDDADKEDIDDKKKEEEKDDNDKKEEKNENDKKEDEPIFLHEDQYAQILRVVFTNTSSSKQLQAQQQDRSVAQEATKIMTTILDEEIIKQMIQEAKQEVLRELQEAKPNKNQTTGEPSVQDQNQKVGFQEIAQKVEEIKKELKEQLKIKGIVDKIKHHLNNECPLIILKVDDMMDGSRWEEFRKALSMLQCSADALIFTTTESIQQAKGYSYPPREPIDYSLIGLYHDTVLELTSQQKHEDNYNKQVFRSILEECVPHEFCMKVFTHALYANPNRSNEELINLHSTLQASPKSFDIIAKKMFMYSYNDLPKEYKSCLLYLAIFPKGQKIRRSTLIERWVAEGLTLKEDWPSSVRQANRCFDALIHRWLVYPADIGSTAKVKSCMIGDLVHGFITSIARKQHFVETRLSHHLARHFSIFNDLQLRSSDRIDKFFKGLSKSSRVSLLKVLDLEGCQCFGGKNQRYLKDICCKMLLLKYLSLRGTDIIELPSEINHLRELEVLDIRQTKVPEDATENILLLKLKRLLAGHNDPIPSSFGTSPSQSNFSTSVSIPRRIDKMVNIEVLSNVKTRHSRDLKDIGKLWQLRKLGVVIVKDGHLNHLLRTISDLYECLCSLSITLPVATLDEGSPSSVESASTAPQLRLRHHPKILESLSISGTTLTGHLLPVITKGANSKLAKVTLSSTLLNQDDLKVLANLPKLQCVRLYHIACTEPMLTFKKDEFICLKYLLVEGSVLTNITFEDGSALELEKMVLSFTSPGFISGVDRLPKLEELELNNSLCGRLLSSFDNAEKIAKLTLHGTLLKQDALQIIAKKPNIRYLVLLDKSFDGRENEITLEKGEFPWLNHLVVDCPSITKIIFTSGSAPRLEKIVWSPFTSLCDIKYLPRLKELKFNGDLVPKEVEEAAKEHKNRPNLKHNEPETQDQANGDEQEDDDDAARLFSCWKKQV